MREPFEVVRSSALVLPASNIDTDQIIPARFLTTVVRAGLGRHAFADWRAREPFTDARSESCAVLVAGENFGCGSSREHAVWALVDWGIRVVISSRIADIFRGNAIKNGLLPIEVDPEVHAKLLGAPWSEVEVDLPGRMLRSGVTGAIQFSIDAFAAHCLQRGLDELDYLLERVPSIATFEQR